MTTTPLWFGAPENRLFGVLHEPKTRRVRGGVVVCPPLGKEQINTYRGMVYLAQLLCDAGLAVLRFDYHGTGDSAGAQDDPAAVSHWQTSIATAVTFLRDAGAPVVGLVGLRAGALLTLAAARDCGPLQSLTLWDPVLDGRRYLREQRAYYHVCVGTEPDGAADSDVTTVPVIGSRFAPQAAADLAGCTLKSLNPTPDLAKHILVAAREDHLTSKDCVRLVDSTGAELITVAGHETFVSPPSFVFSLPAEPIAAIARRITATFAGLPPAKLDITATRTASFGSDVVETFEELGPDRLFAIRTTRAGTDPGGPTVLLTGTASEHRIGPARLWVELARELAAAGITTVRFDRRDVGETGAVRPEKSSGAYSRQARTDVEAAARHVGTAPGQLLIAGLCSGAWGAAWAATRLGNRALVLMNLVIWNFNPGPQVRRAHVDALESPTATALFNRAAAVRQRVRAACRRVPYSLWLLAGKLGVAQVPELLLRGLAARRVRTTITLSPEDWDIFTTQRGDNGLTRLRRTGYDGEIVTYDHGDHSMYGHVFHARMHAELRRIIGTEFALPLPDPVSTGSEQKLSSQ